MLMVDDPREQQIMRVTAPLRSQGYSLEQIRCYLAYEWKVRNRAGREVGYREVCKMATMGAELLHTAHRSSALQLSSS
jgi:hypothetical protein